MSGEDSIIARSPRLRAHPSNSDPVMPQPWADEAVCAETDPEAFFPEKGGSTRDAKLICNGRPYSPASIRGAERKAIDPCPVRDLCLEYALANDERHGIWGGQSERERRKIAKARKEAAA